MSLQKREILIFATAITCLLAVVAVVWAWKKNPNPIDPPSPIACTLGLDTLKAGQYAKMEKAVAEKLHEETADTIHGELTDEEGKPMEGVVVSDGFTCVKTDSIGHYKLLTNKDSRFVYYTIPDYCEVLTHSETDRTALFYQPIVSKRKVYNFTLHRLPHGKEKNYRLIVFGDPQVTNAFNPYFTGPNDDPVKKTDLERFTEETMTDVKKTIGNLPAGTPVYALSMGDNVQYYGGYNASLEEGIRKAMGSSKARVFSVIGNHDQDNNPLYKRKWEDSFGPTDYSFDRGDVHYVCFNNVHFFRGMSYYQPGELMESQLKWLRQDLALADKSKKLIVSYHIPLTFGTRPSKKAEPLNITTEEGHYSSSILSTILKEAKAFKGGYELFCGHTHFAINHEITFHGQRVLEHCHAAACGNIWQSNINICGTPNGYYVYSIEQNRLTNAYYKGTFWPAERQMSLFYANTNFNGESYATDWSLPHNEKVVVANVFNADSRWKVVAVEDGHEHEMKRLNSKGQDAFATGYHLKYNKAVSAYFVSKRNGYLIMNHLYYYIPKSKEAHITVKATDPYGNTYTGSTHDVVTEPFFNYAHYY